MASFIHKVATFDVELSLEERNLLSIAYKYVIVTRRASWKDLSRFELKESKENGCENRIQQLKDYKLKVETEMRKTCNEILSLLEVLIPKATKADAKVFYLKM